MKNFIILFSLIFLLSACGNNNINYEQQGTTTPNKVSQTVLGTYSTKLTDKTPGRLHNIKLASSILDGTVVKPSETFSFNEVIGPRTEKAGYQEATIFDGHGNKTQGYGGGVCQITSTLYNAALGAGLPIEERHTHSREVPYVNEGDDATVSYYDNEDLKFTNNLEKDITINVAVEESKLTVSIR